MIENHTDSSRRTAARRTALAVFLAVSGLLAGCAADEGAAPAAPAVGGESAAAGPIAAAGFEGEDARTIVDRLDALPEDERPGDFVASVRPDELVISDAQQRSESLPMPDDAFYLSAAPYRSTHHDCFYHSLTTCHGELGGETVHVTVANAATGETVIDEDRQVQPNGFVGLWLPRGIDEGTITITSGAERASASISTSNPDDATCLTTLRLQ